LGVYSAAVLEKRQRIIGTSAQAVFDASSEPNAWRRRAFPTSERCASVLDGTKSPTDCCAGPWPKGSVHGSRSRLRHQILMQRDATIRSALRAGAESDRRVAYRGADSGSGERDCY
jgi:hypothetical protein